MLIECKLKRQGGSKVDIGGIVYHFKPNTNDPGDPHLCDVKDKLHAQRFLGIAEGYCLPGDAPEPTPEPVVSTAVERTAEANEANDNPADADDEAPALPPAADDVPLESKSDAELREIIKEATGSYPHPKTGRDKLLAKIRGESDADEG